MTTENRRGRKPRNERARDKIEKECDEIVTLADKARAYEDLENVASHLRDLANRFFKVGKGKSQASEKAIGRAALLILRVCDWMYVPPPAELVEAFELILRLDASADNLFRAKWRTAVVFAASRPVTKAITAQELCKAVNENFEGANQLSWNTARKWLKSPKFQAEVEEARARREFHRNFRAQREARRLEVEARRLEARRNATLPGSPEVEKQLAVQEKPGEVDEKGEHPSGE